MVFVLRNDKSMASYTTLIFSFLYDIMTVK